ncbi:transketolase [Polynucleobacter asymbioticus]|nr:transketolase [Polynucleobacter asymbioticus]
MDLVKYAQEIRLLVLELCYTKKTSHIGGAFSVADILAVLYGEVMNINPLLDKEPGRDRLFYSKGHACTALYAALSKRNFFTTETLLNNFIKDGEYFTSHINHSLPGVELSTGSLGHALGVAAGSALAGKRKKLPYTVYAILSDGELDEGSNWEAIMFAAQNKLNNLILIIDYNKIQSFGRVEDVMALEPFADKFRAFNWHVEEVDGHSIEDLKATLTNLMQIDDSTPKCLIAHTIKGKGVSFMEDSLAWHYKSPNSDEYQDAKKELELQK